MSPRESSGWSNQRGSKASQACYNHPRCNINLVRLVRFSLPLPVFGRIFFFLHPRRHKHTAPFMYHAIPDPAVLQSPMMPNSRRSSVTQSVYYFSFPPGPRFPAFSSSPDVTLLGNVWSPMWSSAPDNNHLLVRTVLFRCSLIRFAEERLCTRGCACSATCTRLLGFGATSCGVLYGTWCSAGPSGRGPCRASV